jgi:DNA-binding winged helix-turn-helix (wHTH) protein
VIRDERELLVSSTGLKLLAILMRESPNVVSRHEIEREVWGRLLPDPDMLHSHFYSLRSVIDRSFVQPLFHKVGATGYCIADLSDPAVVDALASWTHVRSQGSFRSRLHQATLEVAYST